MGALSGLFVHLNTLKEVGEGKTLLLKIKNKQVKEETEGIKSRCFTNLDQTALRAPGYLTKHAIQFHPLMCPTKVEFLGDIYGCQSHTVKTNRLGQYGEILCRVRVLSVLVM